MGSNGDIRVGGVKDYSEDHIHSEMTSVTECRWVKRGVAGDRKVVYWYWHWVSGYTDNEWWAPLCVGASATHLEDI